MQGCFLALFGYLAILSLSKRFPVLDLFGLKYLQGSSTEREDHLCAIGIFGKDSLPSLACIFYSTASLTQSGWAVKNKDLVKNLYFPPVSTLLEAHTK